MSVAVVQEATVGDGVEHNHTGSRKHRALCLQQVVRTADDREVEEASWVAGLEEAAATVGAPAGGLEGGLEGGLDVARVMVRATAGATMAVVMAVAVRAETAALNRCTCCCCRYCILRLDREPAPATVSRRTGRHRRYSYRCHRRWQLAAPAATAAMVVALVVSAVALAGCVAAQRPQSHTQRTRSE